MTVEQILCYTLIALPYMLSRVSPHQYIFSNATDITIMQEKATQAMILNVGDRLFFLAVVLA